MCAAVRGKEKKKKCNSLSVSQTAAAFPSVDNVVSFQTNVKKWVKLYT